MPVILLLTAPKRKRTSGTRLIKPITLGAGRRFPDFRISGFALTPVAAIPISWRDRSLHAP